MIRKLSVLPLAFFAMVCLARQAPADIMDIDLTGVAPQYRQAFSDAEAFWETRLIGYSSQLPFIVKSQLNKLLITASTVNIDGPGGVLGQAGPTQTLTYSRPRTVRGGASMIAIAQQAMMQFDNDDLGFLQASGTLGDVIRHEMAHALGFGSLWVQNGLTTILPSAPAGAFIGRYGLDAYRAESSNLFAPFVPVEQFGGPGTAGGHWDFTDRFFAQPSQNRSELMIGFLDSGIPPDGPDTKFVSETTWASMADLWFAVRGINDGRFVDVVGGRVRWPKWTSNGNPAGPIFITGNGGSVIPEPSTAGLAGLIAAALFCFPRRRRIV